MKSVLLLHTGKSEAYTRLRRLAEGGEIELAVLTEPRNAGSCEDAAMVRTVKDLSDLTALSAAVLDIHRECRVDAVVTPGERTVRPGAYVRSLLGIGGVSYDVANRFTNKLAMKRALEANGIDIPRYRVAYAVEQIPKVADELGWPVVVKPAIGTGAHLTLRLDDRDDFAAFAASADAARLDAKTRTAPLMVEEFVEMEAEYHSDAVFHGAEPMFIGSARYQVPLMDALHEFTGSSALLPSSPEGRELDLLHRAAVEALGLEEGVTHLEAFRRGNGTFLMSEIACRPGGGGIAEMVRHQCGVDLWDAFIDLSIGRRPHVIVECGEGVVVNCDLPLKQGRVTRLTGLESIRALPGLLDLRIYYQPGDVIRRSWFDSSACAGLAIVRVPGPADVDPLFATLARNFSLEAEQTD